MMRALCALLCVSGTSFAAWAASAGDWGIAAFQMLWVFALAADVAMGDWR